MAEDTPFDFIFADAIDVDRSQLFQGDLLRRTPELAEAVGMAHSYYAEAADYSHFLVLTQSCDLVRRGGKCKSRYITLCAVRPLSVAVDREMAKFTNLMDGFPFRVGELDRKVLARQYLERVLNNNVDGMFFIPRGSAETVEEHLCAFLPLSIALRITHYDACLGAKIAQTKEIFAAKIGSLASDLYGKIATPDLHETHPEAVELYRNEFFEELGYRRVAWLSGEQKKALKKRLKTALEVADGTPLTEQQAEQLLDNLPDEANAIVDRMVDVLIKRNLLDISVIEQAKSFLLNDATIKRLARR